MLGVVFGKAQNRIQDPAKLERLVKDLIGTEQWMSLDADVKGDAYEGLLERNAADTKSGAGQYFTPRPLIAALVEVMDPGPDMRICDPACGTGGFFLAAYRHIGDRNPNLDPDQRRHLRSGLFTGWEIVDGTARLCAMNMLLHTIETPDSDSPIYVDDALRADPGERFDMVLTNPPFGKKSSVAIVNHEGRAERQSLTVVATTSGPRPRTSSSTSSSTSRPSSRWRARPRWWCPTTCCSKAAPARWSAAACWPSATRRGERL